MSSFIVPFPLHLSLVGLFLSDVLLMRNFNPLNFYLFTVRTPHRWRSSLCQPLADSCVPMKWGSFSILKKISLPAVKGWLCTYWMKPVEFLFWIKHVIEFLWCYRKCSCPSTSRFQCTYCKKSFLRTYSIEGRKTPFLLKPYPSVSCATQI